MVLFFFILHFHWSTHFLIPIHGLDDIALGCNNSTDFSLFEGAMFDQEGPVSVCMVNESRKVVLTETVQYY